MRPDGGDYLYPVDANVAPVSKLNGVTTRSMRLDVQLDAVGNARDSLAVTWLNQIDTADGAAYRALPVDGDLRILGMYFRALVPQRSRVEAVSGGGSVPATGPAVVEDEAGRMAIGTYLMIPPGEASLTYTWTSPYAASVDETGGSYRLTIQAQPGMVAGPLTLTIRAPDGDRITAASPGLTVSGATATMTVTFDQDIVVGLQYGP